MHDALRDVDVYIEQPCQGYEECLSVRRHTDHPLVLARSLRASANSPACSLHPADAWRHA
jgi:hypothetical protein